MPTTWKALLDTAVNKTEDWFSRLHSHEIVGPVSGGDDTFCRVRRWMKTGRGTSSSIPVYRGGASNKVTFEQRLEGSDGVIYVGSGKVISQIETEAVMQVCVSGEKQPGAEGLEQSEPGERGKERLCFRGRLPCIRPAMCLNEFQQRERVGLVLPPPSVVHL